MIIKIKILVIVMIITLSQSQQQKPNMFMVGKTRTASTITMIVIVNRRLRRLRRRRPHRSALGRSRRWRLFVIGFGKLSGCDETSGVDGSCFTGRRPSGSPPCGRGRGFRWRCCGPGCGRTGPSWRRDCRSSVGSRSGPRVSSSPRRSLGTFRCNREAAKERQRMSTNVIVIVDPKSERTKSPLTLRLKMCLTVSALSNAMNPKFCRLHRKERVIYDKNKEAGR